MCAGWPRTRCSTKGHVVFPGTALLAGFPWIWHGFSRHPAGPAGRFTGNGSVVAHLGGETVDIPRIGRR